MKTRLIIFLILIFSGTVLNAQEYRSLVQTDKNLHGEIKTVFNPGTISLNASSVSIKYDKLKEPMFFYFYKKTGVQDNGEYIRTSYIFSDKTISETGYSLFFVDKYKKPQTKENYKYNFNFVIVMIDNEKYNLSEEIEVTRYTTYYSLLK
jgi:hypothetical protein